MQISLGALLSAILLALTVPVPVGADDRPAVTIRFVLVDSKYKLKFSDTDRPVIEAAAAARLAERLSGRIGFARFTAQSGSDAVLMFELNRQDPAGTSDMREVGFHVTLQRQGRPVGDGVYLMFRPQTESGASIPGRDALLEAIGAKIVDAAGPRGPLTMLLSALPIASAAELMTNPVRWAMPYRHDDLCMDTDNLVRLSNTITLPTEAVEYKFTARTSRWLVDGTRRGRILGIPDPESQAHLDDLKNAPSAQVVVGEVYVVQYSPKIPCDAVIAPTPR